MVCERCDREGCQATALAHAWARAGRPRTRAEFELDRELAKAALEDCHAHEVDWRKRALDAEAKLKLKPFEVTPALRERVAGIVRKIAEAYRLGGGFRLYLDSAPDEIIELIKKGGV